MSMRDEIERANARDKGFDQGVDGEACHVPEKVAADGFAEDWTRGWKEGRTDRRRRLAQRPAPRPWKQQPYQQDHGASIAIVCGGNDPHIVALIGPKNVDDDPDYYTANRYPHDYANARVLECAGEAYDLLKAIAEFMEEETALHPGALVGDSDKTAKELVLDLVRRMDGVSLLAVGEGAERNADSRR